jgi:hypothetical protein
VEFFREKKKEEKSDETKSNARVTIATRLPDEKIAID